MITSPKLQPKYYNIDNIWILQLYRLKFLHSMLNANDLPKGWCHPHLCPYIIDKQFEIQWAPYIFGQENCVLLLVIHSNPLLGLIWGDNVFTLTIPGCHLYCKDSAEPIKIQSSNPFYVTWILKVQLISKFSSLSFIWLDSSILSSPSSWSWKRTKTETNQPSLEQHCLS